MVVLKTVLITYNTPTVENVRGASALPYHLLVERDKHIDVLVFTFNANGINETEIVEIEEKLNIKIHCMQLPFWFQWMTRMHLLSLRIFLRLPFLCYIKLTKKMKNKIVSLNPDLIWVYDELLSILKQFPEYQRIHLGPDTISLYYYRMMSRRFVINDVISYWKCALMYRKYARMERELPTDDNYTYYAVGEEDVRHLQQLNPKVKAIFLRHPHYEVSKLKIENGELKIKFHLPKIKLLIAGQYNLYMKQEADLLVEQINDNVNDNYLKNHYSITFLGKGWEKHVETLSNAGWEVEHINFALDYIEEICKHDIQITPIAIGTGTKGKVLDALANGLLVIGTPYAMENIAVEHGVSCVEYREPQEVMEVLSDIIKNREKYEAMAQAGREAVLKHHDRSLISNQLFSLFKSN